MKQISNSHLRWPKGRRSCVKYISKERINNESISLWIIRFMMQSKPDLTRWFLLSVRILRMNSKKEDVAAVKESFSKMLENGTYKGDLFSDL